MRDTKFTSPDSLRDLYRRPKNPLKDLDEVSQAAQTVAQSLVQPITTGTGGTPTLPSGTPGSVGGGFIGTHKVPPVDDGAAGVVSEA